MPLDIKFRGFFAYMEKVYIMSARLSARIYVTYTWRFYIL